MCIVTDDAFSDDAMDGSQNPVVLPPPELGNLAEIEQIMHVASTSPTGRDSLSKSVINDNYIQKMLPLVSIAEDLEALPELHRLCRIMKTLILLNDTQIIEHVVSDNIVLGVVGALECTYTTRCRMMKWLILYFTLRRPGFPQLQSESSTISQRQVKIQGGCPHR